MRAPLHIQPVRKNNGLKKRSVMRAPLHIQPAGQRKYLTPSTGLRKRCSECEKVVVLKKEEAAVMRAPLHIQPVRKKTGV